MAKLSAPTLSGRCLDTLMMLKLGSRDPSYTSFFRPLNAWITIVTGDRLRRLRAKKLWPRLVQAIRERPSQASVGGNIKALQRRLSCRCWTWGGRRKARGPGGTQTGPYLWPRRPTDTLEPTGAN